MFKALAKAEDWKTAIEKERRHLARDPLVEDDGAEQEEMLMRFMSPEPSMASLPSVAASSAGEGFRVPAPGEAVQMSGMRRRPHLNGSRGEVISAGADDQGFVTVRLLEDPTGPSRMMKVRAHRLRPLGGGAASSPSLSLGAAGASMLSLSSGGGGGADLLRLDGAGSAGGLSLRYDGGAQSAATCSSRGRLSRTASICTASTSRGLSSAASGISGSSRASGSVATLPSHFMKQRIPPKDFVPTMAIL
mmetsp:Transcript_37218/g.79076  ORF Transcript_37218/g.79076 Transcript_37218/m.79076 type:complete len:248 (-) Transcript_37218:117-860(-)